MHAVGAIVRQASATLSLAAVAMPADHVCHMWAMTHAHWLTCWWQSHVSTTAGSEHI